MINLKKEMKSFWFECRHPFGVDDVIASDLAPTYLQLMALKNILTLSKERTEIGTPSTNLGKTSAVNNTMAPSVTELALSSIKLVEQYLEKFPEDD